MKFIARLPRRPFAPSSSPLRGLAPALLAVAALALGGPASVGAAPPPLDLSLELLVDGLERPVFLTHAGDGSGRLFIVEQTGRVRIVDATGTLLPTPFLDLSGGITCCGEQGVLGLAFHPNFPTDDRFFLYLINRSSDTRIFEYRIHPSDPDRADPSSRRLVLALDQPFGNHNGGHVAFGPDGYLYVALGDGGSAGDPFGHGQNVGTLFGSILRLDIDRTDPGLGYAVPPDNPFVGRAGARGEIWAYGLRNPWRFSFDRATGDLLIGDVGQNAWEEIDLAPAGVGGLNFGWNAREGAHCFSPPSGCPTAGLVDPILEYSHDLGCSVTGGYRYRGGRHPSLSGVYLYSDFCSGRLWGATPEAGGAWSERVLLETPHSVVSFGEDEAGELYLLDLGGRVFRIAAANDPDDPGDPPTGDFPPIPDTPTLTSPQVPGFRFWVRITNQDDEVQPVRREEPCLAETLCVGGAVPGRVEVLLRVVGPKGNGRLWPTLVKLTTSEVEVWIEQIATGEVEYYRLPGATGGSSELPGLFDREGFPVG